MNLLLNFIFQNCCLYSANFHLLLQPKIEMTEGLDPLTMLTDDAQIATWNNEGLPTDTMSTENATILTNSARWPLMIDPQLLVNGFYSIVSILIKKYARC